MSNGLKLLDKKAEASAVEIYHPMGNIVLLRKLEGAEFERGIALPEQHRKNAPYPRGVVVATGPGRMLECGQMCPTGVKVNDKVVYNGPTGDLKLNGEELVVIDSAMIICIVQRDLSQ